MALDVRFCVANLGASRKLRARTTERKCAQESVDYFTRLGECCGNALSRGRRAAITEFPRGSTPVGSSAFARVLDGLVQNSRLFVGKSCDDLNRLACLAGNIRNDALSLEVKRPTLSTQELYGSKRAEARPPLPFFLLKQFRNGARECGFSRHRDRTRQLAAIIELKPSW